TLPRLAVFPLNCDMSVHSLRKTQCIPAPIQDVWDFFIDPRNLSSITPPSIRMKMLTRNPGTAIYPGQILEYRLRPFPWRRVYWMTRITQVKELDFFIDEQRKGPYRLWHHQHHFREISGGVEMIDIVHYMLPFGFVGDCVNTLIVHRQLEGI